MPKITDVHYILDGSGSMRDSEENTVKTFNEYLYGLQAERDADYRMTMLIFDDTKTDFVFSDMPVKEIDSLRRKQVWTHGMTPLNDAIGKEIERTEQLGNRERNILFVILTDGGDNASHKYRDKQFLASVVKAKEEQGWVFLFISSSNDAIAQAHSLGIDASNIAYVSEDSVRSGAYNSGVLSATSAYAHSHGTVRKGFADLIDKQ